MKSQDFSNLIRSNQFLVKFVIFVVVLFVYYIIISKRTEILPPAYELLTQLLIAIIIYFFVDFAISRAQERALRQTLLDIFNGDNNIADGMTAEQKQRFALNWLESSYSDLNARDAVSNVAKRYLGNRDWRYRISRGLDVTLQELKDDVNVTIDSSDPKNIFSLAFSPKHYFRVIEESWFSFPHDDIAYNSKEFFVIVSFNDKQLSSAYRNSKCVFRNMVPTEEMHIGTMFKHFETLYKASGDVSISVESKSGSSYSILGGMMSAQIALVLGSETVECDLTSVTYDGTCGILFKFLLPYKVADMQDYVTPPEFRVRISFLQSRNRMWFAESFNEPTLGHHYQVKFDPHMFTGMLLHEFFSLSKNYPLSVQTSDNSIFVNLQGIWIYPVSGAVITWRDPGAMKSTE